MTPITGCPSMQKAMETQNMGKRWVKLMVPSRGSTIHVGEDVTRYCFDEPAEYDSSPRKLVFLVSDGILVSKRGTRTCALGIW